MKIKIIFKNEDGKYMHYIDSVDNIIMSEDDIVIENSDGSIAEYNRSYCGIMKISDFTKDKYCEDVFTRIRKTLKKCDDMFLDEEIESLRKILDEHGNAPYTGPEQMDELDRDRRLFEWLTELKKYRQR